MSADSRRVLVVSFFYPPDPAVGGRRVEKFVRYLPEFGWSPAVLTAETHHTGDPLGDPPVGDRPAPVHATFFFSPWKPLARRRERRGPSTAVALRERMTARGPLARGAYIAMRHVLPMSPVRMPDATLGWVPWAVRQGSRLLESGDFSAILSSAGPPSSHIVASQLQRRSGLPWVADYRDLWSGNHWEYRVPPFRWLEGRLERRVVGPAAALTSTSPTWVDRLADLHQKPARVVYNGFDPADFPAPAARSGGFTLLYVGTLTWPEQALEPLFIALRRFSDESDVDLAAVDFKLEFLGTDPGVVEMLAARHGVGRWVRLSASVSHAASLARQQAATALLFLGWRDPRVGFVSAKIFEYLGAGRPILSVGPPGGDVAGILAECGMPEPSAEPERIAGLLREWIARFARSRDLTAPAPTAGRVRYTRRSQTQRLATLLDSVIGSR